jgi:hypothetical protein
MPFLEGPVEKNERNPQGNLDVLFVSREMNRKDRVWSR